MSIESLAQRAEVAALTAFAPPPVPDLPSPDTAPPAHAATPAQGEASAATASLQERRLRAARELEARLGAHARDLRTLQEALATLRQGTAESLRELRQRSTSLTTEMLRQGARLARQRRELDEELRTRDLALDDRLRPLDAAVAAAGRGVQQQQRLLDETRARLEAMACLHDHLDRIVHRQGRALDLAAGEFRERVTLLREAIDAGQQAFRVQREEMQAQSLEHEALAARVHSLHDSLDALTARVATHERHSALRLQRLGRLLGLALLLCLGVMAWLQLHPTTLPAQAGHRLAALEAELAQQRDHDQTRDALLEQQSGELAGLRDDLQHAQALNERLRQEARATRAQLRRLQARVARLARGSAATTAAVATPRAHSAALAEPGSALSALTTPASGAIPLPPAVPGSRPAF